MATITTLMACMRIHCSNAATLAVVADLAERFGRRRHRRRGEAGVRPCRRPRRGSAPRRAGTISTSSPERPPRPSAEFRAALPKVRELQWRSQVVFGPACEYIAKEARGVDLVVATASIPSIGVFFLPGEAEVGDLLMRLGRPTLRRSLQRLPASN